MAIIYDLLTGAVISERGADYRPEHNRRDNACTPAARPALQVRTPEAEPPCSAYMALLQQVLKEL